MYEGKEAPYVQFFYKNSTETNIPPIDIPGCGTKCPLTKLYDIYKNILPTRDFKDECAISGDQQLEANNSLGKFSFHSNDIWCDYIFINNLFWMFKLGSGVDSLAAKTHSYITIFIIFNTLILEYIYGNIWTMIW